MYSSLDRIDLVTRSEDTGQKQFIQTDHRSAAEIQRQEELSILFALTRVLNARQEGEAEGGTRVFYTCAERPPDFLQRAVTAAGGKLQVNDEDLIYEGVLGTPGELANEAFRRLARKVLGQREWRLEEGALAALEQEYLHTPGPEEDETGYWTRVVELAAVAGELLRARYGGQWIEVPDFSTVPFVFHLAPGGGDSPRLNALGRAERFLTNGERDSLLHLLRAAEDHVNRRSEPRPVLLTLKPPGWANQQRAVCRPVLEGEGLAAEVPLAAYGEDMPNSFAIFTRDGTRERDMDALHMQACENLKSVEVQVQEIDESDGKMVLVSGSYFAAEKLLDEAFMNNMHERLKSPVLAAGVPCKGMLFIADAGSQHLVGGMLAILESEHAKAGSEAISRLPLLVAEGKICGVAKPASPRQEAAPAAPKEERRPGFFSRLFGRLKS